MRLPSVVPRAVLALALLAVAGAPSRADEMAPPRTFAVHPVGHVAKADGHATIVVDPRYAPALLGMAPRQRIWVLWWFDRNDTPEQRSILQVHPRGNPANPLTGVFSTRAPVPPNLIALTLCRVVSVAGNVIEIDGIDAFADTPVLDIKNAHEVGE